MTYTVEIPSNARRAIRKLPRDVQQKVAAVIDDLATDPRPVGVVKMRGYQRRYRIRISNYRVLYDIYDDRLLVVVVEAGHRKDVYR